jgi:hypothetical protein
LVASLAGCPGFGGPGFTGVTAGIQAAGQQIGPTVGAIDADIYAIAVAKYQAAQVFKAQIDGNIILPPLPPPIISPTPVTPVPPPVVVVPPTPIPLPDGPIVTPNSLGPHASRGVRRRVRQQIARSFWQWNQPSFTLTTDLLAVPLR